MYREESEEKESADIRNNQLDRDIKNKFSTQLANSPIERTMSQVNSCYK